MNPGENEVPGEGVFGKRLEQKGLFLLRGRGKRGGYQGRSRVTYGESGLEVIIGTKMDDQFGPVIMYGLGGIMVEILKDVSFRVLPITSRTARHMIEETKSYPILNGVRGRPPGDIKALIKLLLICSELIESYPEIREMDFNPVRVYQSGLEVVGARVILKDGVS